MGTQNPYTKGRRAHAAWANGFELGVRGEVGKPPSRQGDERDAFVEGWKAGDAERKKL